MVQVKCDTIVARGHENISATHRTTLEITRDTYVTPRGDCIIACCADKSVADLDPELKEIIKNDKAIVLLILRVRDAEDVVICQGSSRLTLSDSRKLIVRKSRYVDNATLCINANKSAADVDRKIVNYLIAGEQIQIRICAFRYDQLD